MDHLQNLFTYAVQEIKREKENLKILATLYLRQTILNFYSIKKIYTYFFEI